MRRGLMPHTPSSEAEAVSDEKSTPASCLLPHAPSWPWVWLILVGFVAVGGVAGGAASLLWPRPAPTSPASTPGSVATAISPDVALAAAETARAGSEYGRAMALYQQVLQVQPDRHEARVRLADLLRLKRRFDEAEAQVNQVLRAVPDQPEALLLLGRLKYRAGNLDAALAAWRAVPRFNEATVEAARELAWAAERGRDRPQAVTEWQRLLTLRADDGEAAWRLSLWLLPDQPAQAATLIEQLTAHPEAAWAERAKRLRAALAETAGEVDPAYKAARLGITLVSEREPERATALFARAVALEPSYADAWRYLAYCQLQTLQLGEADRALQRAQALEPDDVFGLRLSGLLAMARNDAQAAAAALSLAVAKDPNDALAWADLGAAQAAAGDYDSAETAYRTAALRMPELELARAHFHLDHAYHPLAGIEAAERAVVANPSSAEARGLLGWGLHLTSREVEAAANLREAVRLAPTDARLHYRLGLVLQNLNDLPGARAALARAIDLDLDGTVSPRAQSAWDSLAGR